MGPPTDAEAPSEAFWEANDTLHVLPLSYIPLQTRALRNARMIKNTTLHSVIELFAGKGTGSGQILPRDLPRAFTIEDDRDLQIIDALAQLASYDIYSLRIELRRLKIDVEANKFLRLSPAKQAALGPLMTRYVRPLIAHVYGMDRVDVRTFADIARLFRDPDVETALANLRNLAAKLRVELDQVPRVLAEYGDAFLSLSYFEHCLEEVIPDILSMRATIEAIRHHPQTREDMNMQHACDAIDHRFALLIAETKGLTDVFHLRTQGMWDDISPASFQALQTTIQSFQADIGRNLCVAVVKSKGWSRAFPSESAGNLAARARFMLSDIRPGIDRIAHLDFTDVGARLAGPRSPGGAARP